MARGPKFAPGEKPNIKFKDIKKVFGFMKISKLKMTAVVFLIIIASACDVAQSYFIKPITNWCVSMIGNTNVNYVELLNLCLVMLAVVLIGGIAAYTYNIMMVTIGSQALFNLRSALIEKLEKLSIKYYDKHQHGEIMSRFTNDVDTIRELISRTIPEFISTFIRITSSYVFMLLISWRLTLVVTGMCIFIIIFMKILGGLGSKNFIRQQKEIGRLNGFVEEMIEGAKVVKVFNHEQIAKADFEEVNESYREASCKANIFASILRPIVANLANFTYVLVGIIGTVFIIGGSFDVGSLNAFIKFVKSFTMPITNLSEQFNAILMSMAGIERIFDILNEPDEVDEGWVTLVYCERDKDGKLIERDYPTGMWAWKYPHYKTNTVTYTELKGDVLFYNVDFGYDDEKMVLKNMNLEAKAGEKIAFVGHTGAGKTTITNLINRFYDVQKGKIYYDGIDVKKIKKDDLRRSLAMVLQDTHLFTGTIYDNIRFGKPNAGNDEVIEAAKLANAHGFISHLPDGYNTLLTGDGANLSQGQRQLLAIARAAIANPPVLILDEATSSIDTRTERLIEKGMDKLMHGRTTFVIAHRLSTVRNADNICVLDSGEIIESGNHDELMKQKGTYYDLQKGMFELN